MHNVSQIWNDMIGRFIAAVVTVAWIAACNAHHHGPITLPIPPESPLNKVLTEGWQAVYSLDEIPPPVAGVLPRLAAPGQPFESTDVIYSSNPRSRLILAAHRRTDWFVAYEQGGRGYHHVLVILDLGTPRVMYRATGYVVDRHLALEERIDIPALQSAVRKGWFAPSVQSSGRTG